MGKHVVPVLGVVKLIHIVEQHPSVPPHRLPELEPLHTLSIPTYARHVKIGNCRVPGAR